MLYSMKTHARMACPAPSAFPIRILGRVRSTLSLTLGAIAALGTVVGVASAQTIIPIAPIAGGSISRAAAVNATGTAAAGYSDNVSSADRAIRWQFPASTTNMGLVPGGVFGSYAVAIDSTGQILAGYGDSGSSRAFRWVNGSGYQLLPLVTGTGSYSQAFGISQSGAVVVGTSGFGPAARAFYWISSTPGSSLNLGVLAGQTTSGAAAVSGDGTAVVGSSGTRAFHWTSGGGMTDLGSLPGQVRALGEAVNTNGTVITGRYNNGSEFGYRWTQATGMVALPQTPNGCTALRPRAINGDGSLIIGQVVDNVAGFTAFVWTPAMGSQLLANHLQARGVNLTGWQISDATGISADGSAMCGNGLYNGSPVGWVVRGLRCPTNFSEIIPFAGWACIGSDGTIATSFVTSPGVSVRWWRNGVLLANGLQPSGSTISGATATALQITNMQLGDAGNYQVGISDQGACETITSTYFSGPTSAPSIVSQPSANTACQGQNPSLFCAATAATGTVTYGWQKFVGPPTNAFVDLADGATGNGSTYAGTGTTTFSIISAQPADSGTYRCMLGNRHCFGVPQAYSNAVPFTITPTALAVTGPSESYQCTGDNDAFISVSVVPATGCTYKWQKFGGPFVVPYFDINDGPTGNGGFFGQTNTATLGVYSFNPGEFNFYRCRVTGPCGQVVFSNPIYLGGVGPVAIVTNPSNVSICPGDDDISFSVTATPGATFQWQKFYGAPTNAWFNISNGPTGNGGNYGQTNTATMGIYGIGTGDYGQYRCVVSEPCFFSTAISLPASLLPPGPPPVTSQPTGGPVNIGATKVLTVVATGVTTYQWWRYVPAFPIYAQVGNGSLPSGAIVTGATGPTLTISNFQAQDAGQYYCKLISECNFGFSAVVTLTVGIACSIADIAGGGPNGDQPDGILDGSDFVAFINSFSTGDVNVDPRADIVGGGPNGLDPDGIIDGSDFIAFINAFAAGC